MPSKCLPTYISILACLFVNITFCGCKSSGRNAVFATLGKAESIVSTHPDSAYDILCSISPPPWQGEALARFSLLFVRASYATGRELPDSSLLNTALHFYAHSCDSFGKAWSHCLAAQTYIKKGMEKEAMQHLQQAKKAAKATEDILLRKTLEETEKTTSVSLAASLKEQAIVARQEAVEKERLHDFKESAYSWEKYVRLDDSLHKIVCRLEKQTSKHISAYSKNKDVEEIRKREEKIRNIDILLFFSLIATGVGFLVLYSEKCERRKLDIVRSKSDLLNRTILLLQEKNKDLLLRQQLLYKQMEETLRNKRSEITVLKTEQDTLRKNILDTNEIIKKIKALHYQPVSKKIKDRKDLLFSSQDCEQLYEAVNMAYDNWVQRLRKKYAMLTESDVFVCCLLKTGVNNLDIAILTDSSIEALRKRKYRMKRDKFQITDNALALEDFLRNF